MPAYKSPTGSPITGILETLFGIASINGLNEDGSPDYADETEVLWDTQTPVLRKGEMIFVDEDGEEWRRSQIVRVEDDADEDTDANERRITVSLSVKERDAILAGLRLIQGHLDDPERRNGDVQRQQHRRAWQRHGQRDADVLERDEHEDDDG